jgi:hypothetical protein
LFCFLGLGALAGILSGLPNLPERSDLQLVSGTVGYTELRRVSVLALLLGVTSLARSRFDRDNA